MTFSLTRETLGSLAVAEEIATRAQKSVPAYQDFLQRQGITPDTPFKNLPLQDKSSYILAYPFQDLVSQDIHEPLTICFSSGSSGKSCYWPQLQSAQRAVAARLTMFLEGHFLIQKRKTLAIMGMTLGGWISSESYAWGLKQLAANAQYPFLLFNCGNRLDSILEAITTFGSDVDQILLFLVPSIISHLLLKASDNKIILPLHKMKYIVGGEPFPEDFRIHLQQKSTISPEDPFLFSFYGSADTGALGGESPASIALRKVLHQDPDLAAQLGIALPTPHFFHLSNPELFLEIVDHHLCVTRWQGIPLVRYSLYDRVQFYHWTELKKNVLQATQDKKNTTPWVSLLAKGSDRLPDLIAVTGRLDKCLIFGSENLPEYVLDEAVRSVELSSFLTGLYQAQVMQDNDRQYLVFDLELCPDVIPEENLYNRIYYAIMQKIARIIPHFEEDWKHVYSAWDKDPEQRVLRLNLWPWPYFSQAREKTIKHRSILEG